MDTKIIGYKNDVNNDFESSKQDCLPEIIEREPASVKKLQISDFYTQKMFLQQLYAINKTLPKQIMTLEEKYIRHCLELIHMSAMRANSSKVNLLCDRFSSRVRGCDALFYVEDPIVGSITTSTSMINLLKSSLLNQLDTSNDYENASTVETRESLSVDSSSHDIQKKRVVSEDQMFVCDPMHKRLVSLSSTNSTFSDPSSSSSSSLSSYNQGMLHCSWNNGFPRYVFSVEDQREVYTTNLSKIESDYIYTFYSRNGKRDDEIHDEESDCVGKMRVSTSFTLCPLGTEIMETRFILYGTELHSEGGPNAISQTVKKNKGLSKKVSNIFRGSHNRRKTASKFDGSVVIQENLLESNEEVNLFPSNLELAAIVVKDHTQKKVEEVGGWGLKFLKEGGHKQKVLSPVPCRQNTSHGYSSSMDVLVPAGFHGGPRTKNGGPSGLVDRWRSGGSCDCGGWDLGCPLAVLNAGLNNKDVLYKDGVFGKSNSFELFTQGCKQSLPVIEVTNVHDGLYYIHYQSTVSALQSLSISVAIIHSHSPTLKPKVYKN